jgi:hypothetical protein
MTKQFDNFFKDCLTRLTEAPVYDSDPEALETKYTEKIPSGPGGGYLISKIAQQLNVRPEAVIKMIFPKFYERVFPNGVNPAKNEEQFKANIMNALTTIISDIEKDKNIKIKGAGDAIKGYTARILSNFGDFKKEYGGGPATAPETSDKKELDGTKPKPSIEAPKAFRASSQVDYVFEPDVKAGTMTEEELRIYNSVDASSSYNGKELIDYLKDEVTLDPREDLNLTKISRLLTSLMSKGVLTSSVKVSDDSEISALEMPAGGQIDLEREAPDVMDAYREFEKSSKFEDY